MLTTGCMQILCSVRALNTIEKDSTWRLKSGPAGIKIPISQTASALALRDPSAVQPALPLLIDLLDVPEVRVVVLRAVAHLGAETLPAILKLSELLDYDDAFIRVGATYALARIGPDAAEILGR